jgi:hypothetical protein
MRRWPSDGTDSIGGLGDHGFDIGADSQVLQEGVEVRSGTQPINPLIQPIRYFAAH